MGAFKHLVILVFLFASLKSYSQFTVDAQLRPRFEYRHGYKTLFPDNVNPAIFVSQRTRINFYYRTEKLHFYLSPQDIRVWGDVPQLNVADENGFSLHQAWGEIFFTSNLSLKLGRQEIIYDDHRIFGNVDWAQQGRSHDAGILKFEPTYIKLHIGGAYNQDKESLTGNTLTTDTYKTFQYMWLHKDWEKLSASFLFLNNGFQFLDETDDSKNETRYSQTAGFHLNAKTGKFNYSSNLYYQFGKDISNNNLNAYLISLESVYHSNEYFSLGLGGEWQSGNNYGAPANGKNEAFSPLYGTNHKFNGYMDYFYVGNHFNNVGLTDLYATANYSFNNKSKIQLAMHQFLASAKINTESSKNLGSEIDLVTSYKLSEFAAFQAGYSQFFTSKGIEIVKDNFDGNSNNWAWVMLTIDPVLMVWQTQDNLKPKN